MTNPCDAFHKPAFTLLLLLLPPLASAHYQPPSLVANSAESFARTSASSRWEIEKGVVRKVRSGSSSTSEISATAIGINRVDFLVANPYDGGAWVIGDRRIVALDAKGRSKASGILEIRPDSVRMAADERLWLRSGNTLTSLNRDASPARRVPIPASGQELLGEWEIDAMSQYAWLLAPDRLLRVDLATSGPPTVVSLSSPPISIALDAVKSSPWVLFAKSLIGYRADGKVLREIELVKLGLGNASWVVFDQKTGELWVSKGQKTSRVSRDGRLLGEMEGNNRSLASVPLTIRPQSRFLGAASSSQQVQVSVETSCSDSECNLGDDWVQGYAMKARIGSRDLTPALTFDAAKSIASIRLPDDLKKGKHAVVFEVTDAFGHRSQPISKYVEVKEVRAAPRSPSRKAAVAKTDPTFCVATPEINESNTFVPFAALERFEIRGGGSGPSDWELALGTNVDVSSQRISVDWVWEVFDSFWWRLTYDAAGTGTLEIASMYCNPNTWECEPAPPGIVTFEGGAGGGLRSGNAVRFRSKKSGGGNVATLTIDEINGVPIGGTVTADGGGSGTVESDAVYALNPGSGFTASGWAYIRYNGSTPPPGNKVHMTVTAGNVTCNQPPTVTFVSPPEGEQFMYPGAISGYVTAEDPEGQLASLSVAIRGPRNFDWMSSPSDPTYIEFDTTVVPVGMYSITATATDATGMTSSQTRTVTVAYDEIDAPFLSVWSQMASALSAGNIEQALEQFSPNSREKFARVFADLGAQGAAVVVNDLSPTLRRGVILDSNAEFTASRVQNGSTHLFFIGFIQDEDGQWQIDDM